METTARSDDGPIGQLVSSARGWHGVQLAVLAFIGLCGVLSEADPDLPRGLQVLAGSLAMLALALACVATFVVARVAWPFAAGTHTPAHPAADTAAGVAAAGARRLWLGVVLTYAAVAIMALAASSAWWPTTRADGGGAADGVTIQLTDRSGATACGTLVDAPAGTVRLATDEGTIEVAVERLVAVAPADGC